MEPGQVGRDRLRVCPVEEHRTTVETGMGKRLLAPNTWVLPCFSFGSSPKTTGTLSQSPICHARDLTAPASGALRGSWWALWTAALEPATGRGDQ